MEDIKKLINKHLIELETKYENSRRSCDPNKAEYYRGGVHALKRLIKELKEVE